MAETVTVTLYSATTVGGTANTVVLDTTNYPVYWRRYDSSNTYIEEFLGTYNGGANWSADVPDGRYQCWKSAYPDTTSGNRVNTWHGGATKYRWVGDNALPYVPKVTDGSGTYWESGGLEYRSPIATITENTSLISGAEVDSRIATELADYAKVNDDNTFEAGTTQIFDGVTVFTGDDPPSCSTDPTEDEHLTNKLWVENLVSTSAVGTQVSVNEIFLMPNGSQETNKVYTTYQGIFDWALAQPPSSSRQITITIKGMGNAGQTVIVMLPDTTSGLLFAKNYLHWNGINQSIKLEPPDDTVSVATLGLAKYSNLTFYKNDNATDPIFTNLEFHNCIFDLTVNSVTFNNCKLYNCIVKVNTDGDSTATFTSCTGTGNTTNQDWGSSAVRGDSLVPKADF